MMGPNRGTFGNRGEWLGLRVPVSNHLFKWFSDLFAKRAVEGRHICLSDAHVIVYF